MNEDELRARLSQLEARLNTLPWMKVVLIMEEIRKIKCQLEEQKLLEHKH